MVTGLHSRQVATETEQLMRAPCGKALSCEQCPFDDCTFDGISPEEWDAAKAADADARHFTESKLAAQKRAYREANREKLAAQQRAYREANREKYNAYMREYRRRRKGVERNED